MEDGQVGVAGGHLGALAAARADRGGAGTECSDVDEVSSVHGHGPHFGNITGSTASVVKMQRSLCPHSDTTWIACFAPSCSLTYFTNASPRARRVGPCAMAR